MLGASYLFTKHTTK